MSSVVFAEANWYGSPRASGESVGSQIVIKDGGSHWGIRGSAEASEGLTAVYWIEHQINFENVSLANSEFGRISNG